MSLVINKIPRVCFVAMIWIIVSGSGSLPAQEGEKLPATADRSAAAEQHPLAAIAQEVPPLGEDPPRRRIVDGRPRFYLFKRVINPLTGLTKFTKGAITSSERRLLAMAQQGTGPSDERGFSFLFGGAGSGSGMGTGVRFFDKGLFGTKIRVDIPLLITYKDYQVFAIDAKVPLLGDNRLNFDFGTAYRSRAKDNFWGIGNDTLFPDRTRFRSVTRELQSGFSSQMGDHWRAGLHVSYRNIGITKPKTSSFESAQEVLDPATLPGLLRGAELLSGTITLENDTKDNKYIPSTGGLRRLEVSLNEGLSGGDFSFWNYRLDLQQFVPLDKPGRKILAFRAMFETNQEKGGSEIPFFELTALGGANTLRSFQNLRYWDKSGVAFLAEYRYRVWRAFDWALFMETGQVAPEPGDFVWNRFHSGYGFRFIIRATPTVPVSFDFAHGEDGWRVYFRFKPSF